MEIKEIIKTLKKRQKQLGYSNYRLAVLSGVSQSSIKRLFDMTYDDYRIGFIIKVAKALQLRIKFEI